MVILKPTYQAGNSEELNTLEGRMETLKRHVKMASGDNSELQVLVTNSIAFEGLIIEPLHPHRKIEELYVCGFDKNDSINITKDNIFLKLGDVSYSISYSSSSKKD